MGVRLLVAQNRLALRMTKKKGKDVSLRSIQRAWQDRAKWFEKDRKNSSSIGGRIMKQVEGPRQIL
jgi:hypothetical protein